VSLRILLADDHGVLRRGLKEILAEEFPGAEFGEVGTAREVLELIQARVWDAIILDISMPGRSGLDVLKEIKQIRPALPVLVVSMHPEEQYAVRALKAGASGYVTKARAAADLVTAIKKIFAGGKHISSTVAEKLLSHLQIGADIPPHERLSNREYQIMLMIGSGLSFKEIAAELSLSVQTISTHRFRLLKKMGLRTKTELIRYALENKLLD
jgi:two-component system, NarL family, invasion response regulator UvrY